jgi:hypothetical protein
MRAFLERLISRSIDRPSKGAFREEIFPCRRSDAWFSGVWLRDFPER